MFGQLSDSARRAMLNAEKAARGLNHEYVGTEHILLGLIEDETGTVACALADLGASARMIRQEVEQMVAAGSRPVPQRRLPLTPRAEQALALAEEDARFLQQDRIGPEHLFFGLLREREGVAGQVLRSLGLQPEAVAETVFKHRLMQLKYVEQIVRPVRCTTVRKRKTREELLAHLTVIYDEELSRLAEPDAAWRTAADRFGGPAELTCELEQAVSWSERVSYFVEKWVGWRPPETANRWMARFAVQMTALVALGNVAVAVALLAEFGWSASVWIGMRPLLAMLFLLPALVFVLGASFFQMRDSVYGVFGSRKSKLVAGSMALLMGLAVFATLQVFLAVTTGHFADRDDLLQIAVAAFAIPLFALLIVRSDGSLEIHDARWACMKIDAVPQAEGPMTESA